LYSSYYNESGTEYSFADGHNVRVIHSVVGGWANVTLHNAARSTIVKHSTLTVLVNANSDWWSVSYLGRRNILETYFLETETWLNSWDQDINKFGWLWLRRDVGRSRDPLQTETWRLRHLMLNYNSRLLIYHSLYCLCLVLKDLVYVAMMGSIICAWLMIALIGMTRIIADECCFEIQIRDDRRTTEWNSTTVYKLLHCSYSTIILIFAKLSIAIELWLLMNNY